MVGPAWWSHGGVPEPCHGSNQGICTFDIRWWYKDAFGTAPDNSKSEKPTSLQIFPPNHVQLQQLHRGSAPKKGGAGPRSMDLVEYLKRCSTKLDLVEFGKITHHCHWLVGKKFVPLFALLPPPLPCAWLPATAHHGLALFTPAPDRRSRVPCRMDLPGPTTSVGTRTDYSVGPWDYPACATWHLMAWGARTTVEKYSDRKLYIPCTV
jgi:hypothetical protein